MLETTRAAAAAPASFAAELKRRRVYQAGAMYAAAAFVVWQAADIAVPALELPPSIMRAVVLLALAGFPLVLVLAWFFDLSRHGLLRTADEVTAAADGGFASDAPGALMSSDADTPQLRSIVVLPFANMGGHPEDEYFSDGLTDEITADLGRVRALRVICRTSAMTLKGSTRSARDVGRELGVGLLLEGSVRRAGGTVRIMARLVDTQTESHIWSDRFDVATDDILDVQERVARRIVAALGIELGVDEERMLAARPIADAVAYDCYLRARHEGVRATAESVERAVALLRQGLEYAPGNTRLQATIAVVSLFGMRAQGRLDNELLDGFARDAADILARDPRSSDAHLISGVVHFERGEQVQAAKALEHAVELDLSNHDALSWLGVVYLYAGRVERARPIFERLRRQDPLSAFPFCIASAVEWFDGNFEAGIEPMLRCLELAGGGAAIWRWHWGYLLMLLGRYDEAREEAERLRAVEPDGAYTQQLLAMTAAVSGDMSAARAHLQRINSDHSDHHLTFHVAECYALTGQVEHAASLVEAAVARGFFPYAFIALHNPFIRNLQGVPQYDSAVREAKRKWQEFRA